jgi:hypothetical protein
MQGREAGTLADSAERWRSRCWLWQAVSCARTARAWLSDSAPGVGIHRAGQWQQTGLCCERLPFKLRVPDGRAAAPSLACADQQV